VFKLNAQKKLRLSNTRKRIDNISTSIHTIAKAVEQQQCNLSEGSIRLYHLLEALPLVNKPDFSKQFPGFYQLYNQVKEIPTHDSRKLQTKATTNQQDIDREELEAKLESRILAEMAELKTLSV
jgi:hypothetical protein